MNVRIGTAPDSWGVWFPSDPKQTPWKRYLDEVAEAGYRWSELGPYGYLPTDADALRRELERRKIQLTASFVMQPLEDSDTWPLLEQQIREGAELVSALGGQYIVLIDDTYTDLVTGEPKGPTK